MCCHIKKSKRFDSIYGIVKCVALINKTVPSTKADILDKKMPRN